MVAAAAAEETVVEEMTCMAMEKVMEERHGQVRVVEMEEEVGVVQVVEVALMEALAMEVGLALAVVLEVELVVALEVEHMAAVALAKCLVKEVVLTLGLLQKGELVMEAEVVGVEVPPEDTVMGVVSVEALAREDSLVVLQEVAAVEEEMGLVALAVDKGGDSGEGYGHGEGSGFRAGEGMVGEFNGGRGGVHIKIKTVFTKFVYLVIQRRASLLSSSSASANAEGK